MKAAIFARYRTLSEMLGIVLLEKAQVQQSHCLMETSGRDVAMFEYVDRFFDAGQYEKLALHFQINDLTAAQKSVDNRMKEEIALGIDSIRSGSVMDIVNANKGGRWC